MAIALHTLMPLQPLELTVDLQPQSRFDALDVRARATALHGDVLEPYPRCLYNSFHTTAGFLNQSLAWRLSQRRQGLTGYMDAFRAVFPQGAGYRHDELELRHDLSAAQRKIEPKNADSHLAFMAAGLRTCVIYVNRRNEAVPFVDLDGVNDGRPRLRQAGIVGYTAEEEVCRTRIEVPVSGHPIDSINLRAPALGLARSWSTSPTRREILGRLVPAYVEISIYRALLESTASEHRRAHDRDAQRVGERNNIIDDLTCR